METLESSRICRLCGKQSGISINIFDKNESHVKKINAILPVMVHEMDLLPKHMCHRCSYKLEEFHKFYVDCLKTDADLKSQLSWMRKENSKETIGVPMVHIENVKMKLEPPDYDVYEMNPMVDNVNYINSVSSVTFPVNGIQPNGIPEGITYTAYARCACYCDKTDQSNQTVCTNYKNTIPRCNRLKNVTSGSNGCANELQQAVKKNVLANKSHRKRSNKELSTSIIVRNLRPRKGFIDYTGTKKKHNPVISSRNESRSKITDTKFSTSLAKFSATQIKVEPFHGVEGRTLRPRKGTIDYIGPKRKYSKFIDTNQRSPEDDKYHRSIKKQKVRNIANKLKIPMKKMPILLENTIKLGIKQEQQLPDPEDTVPFHESVSATLSKNCERRRDTIHLASQIDSLPNDFVANVQNSRIDGSLLNRGHPNIIVGRLRKIRSNRIAPINYPPKYLRSQNLYLRSGKIKKFDNIQLSSRKLQSLGNITNNSQTVGTNLIKTIRGINTSKKMSASLIDNIKRYCEECNTSFFNRELFKLHACYH
ncbi:uncharacterized protein LOC117609505 isoform X1 [Osmia lignaria lignaria]|uniref:uncharacterized protein LOC117609505 isoform X1 n=2 Tax=Osmia lignaria lignaria TaxID=1437193 RepID=UPI00402BCDC8